MGLSSSGERLSVGWSGVSEGCIVSTPKTSCSDGFCRWSLCETRLFCTPSPFLVGVLVLPEGKEPSPTVLGVAGLPPPSTFSVDDEDMIKRRISKFVTELAGTRRSQHAGEKEG